MQNATPAPALKTVNQILSSPTLPPALLPRLGSAPTLREEGGEALALSGIAHDARNLVTALGLCAELISAPGVLAPKHGHFGAEIRSLAESSAQLVRRLTELTRKTAEVQAQTDPEATVTDLSESVQKMRSLLTAIAGPVMEVQFACLPCAGHLRLSEESLSRILVNLVRNAADAMPTGGRIRITTQRGNGASFLWAVDEGTEEQTKEYLWDDLPHAAKTRSGTVVITVEDNGPGIPTEFLERVFDAGFTTRQQGKSWPESLHRGLGLSIVRELVQAAGGTVRALSSPTNGARLEIELPLTNVTSNLLSERRQDAQTPDNDATMNQSFRSTD
ncbi:MAG TPA: HAMP domain-containing sensor histidine kinase [Acidobacteriaceae bacterium]|nr:HAMP domain-containing sensor histidine kinase [Acidobacteriaceae bacterium]